MASGLVIGREREIAEANGFLADVAERSRGLLLAGEPGMGKTTIWSAVVDEALVRDFAVLVARPSESEAELAFSVLTDLFRPVDGATLAELRGFSAEHSSRPSGEVRPGRPSIPSPSPSPSSAPSGCSPRPGRWSWPSTTCNAQDIAVGPGGDVYASDGSSRAIVRFAEDKAKPGTANVPGTITAKGGTAKIAYTLSGVACPSEVGATATLTGAGIAGKAAGLKLKAGKNTIRMKLSKAASAKATFKIVLKTNGRPTTELRSVTVRAG